MTVAEVVEQVSAQHAATELQQALIAEWAAVIERYYRDQSHKFPPARAGLSTELMAAFGPAMDLIRVQLRDQIKAVIAFEKEHRL